MGIVKSTLVGLLMGALVAGGAVAGVVAGSTPYAGGAFGQQSDAGSTDIPNGVVLTQSFVAPAPTVLEAIRWWGFHTTNSGGPSFDNFVVMLDGVAQTGTLSVVLGSGGFDEYTLDIPDADLTASVLSIFNNSGDVEWFWQSASAVGNPGAASADSLAFSLLGRQGTVVTVDEPTTTALILAAAASLVWTRRRRAAAPALRAPGRAARCA